MMTGLRREAPVPSVLDFYAGKSVLLTGAAGFLGSILLEILLRCCPRIRWVYILLREKKGVHPEDRKQVIFQKVIFTKIKETQPEVLEKVRVISGDVSQIDMGLSSEDLGVVLEDVSVVFHCASDISFSKTLRYTLLQNLVGTDNIINMCRKLKHLEALVYTSTAYSNSNRLDKPILEIVYKYSVHASYITEQVRKEACDEMLLSLMSKCDSKWPNSYVFSKSMAENLLAEKASDLPVVIVRPSMITICWKGAYPGYIEKGTTMVYLCLGIGEGFINTLRMDPEKNADHVPVDVVANAHVVSAWSIATSSWASKPLVINCTSWDVRLCTWNHFHHVVKKFANVHSLPKNNPKLTVGLYKSAVPYRVSAFLNHYAPAYVLDILLRLYRRKPMLVRFYDYLEETMKLGKYFMLNDWEMRSDNFRQLGQQLETQKAEVFYLDLKQYSIEEVCKIIPNGIPFLYTEKEKKTREEREKISRYLYLITQFIKWFLIAGFVFIIVAVMGFVVRAFDIDI